MNIYYVYQYIREDGTPYYVGKGKNDRAFSNNRRVKRPDDPSRIVFVAQNLSEDAAFQLEKDLIQQYGRKDLGTGTLHNMTDGGEGQSGITPEMREKKRLQMLLKNQTYLQTPEVKTLATHITS